MKQNRKIPWVGSAAPVLLLIMLALPWPAVGGPLSNGQNGGRPVKSYKIALAGIL